MKQIKDYIGKNYAIHCDTQEKHDKIYELLKEQQYKYWSGNQNYWKRYGEEFCFCLDEKDLTFASTDWCKNKHTILKAEEFLEPESLVGRYVRVLRVNSWSGAANIGDYLEIAKDKDGILYFENYEHSSFAKNRLKEDKETWELMPNGWTPEKEKPKFEIGKWYKINNNWYAKFDTIHNSGELWRFSNSITASGIYQKNFGQIEKDKVSIDLLTDLSEIQQYLPNDHPDKQKPEETKPNLSDLYNTYIPLNNEEEYKQLLKFLPTIGFKLANNNYFKGCPSPTIEFYKNDVFNVLANGGQVYNKKLSISDLAKYGFKLQQTSENMFKKGDYIVITESNDVKDFKANFCFKIRQNPGSTWDCYVELDGQGRPNAWNSNYFKWRYATKEEENEYNRLNKPFDVTTLVKNQPIKNNEEWIPQVGEYAIMEKAGGWSYSPDNNGCLAIITAVNKRWMPQINKDVPSISGKLINPKTITYEEFTNVPIYSHNGKDVVVRKALPHEIPIEKKPISLTNNSIKPGDWVKLEKWASNEYFKVSRIEGNSLYLQYDGEEWEYNLNQGKWLVRNNTPQTTNTKTDDFGSLQVTNTQTTDITIPKRASVTLKITEKEVNINIKKQKPVKI